MTDEELVHRFEACTLPADDWTHRAHLRVAFVYLRDHDWSTAVKKMRNGIQAYAAARNVPDGPTTGYNETTTVAFLHLVAAMMSAYGETLPTPDGETFCDAHPQLLNKHILRLFYSPEQRMHPQAKTEFVEPDLTPLPPKDRDG